MDKKALIDDLLKHEGGFVNDPDDPGGATNYGVTRAVLAAYRGTRVSVRDVKALKLSEARKIYEQQYLIDPKIDQLPENLISNVFDMHVNAGSNAIKLLQKTMNKFGPRFGAPLMVDGALGPKSIARAHAIDELAGPYLVDAYAIERREFYYRLADRRAASRKYARTRAGGKGGWIKRAESFLSKRFHYSAADHKNRIKNWS